VAKISTWGQTYYPNQIQKLF